jgi:hypothetical protein
MLAHINLISYYKMIFALAQHHKYSIDEIEGLIPFERDIYVEMLLSFIQEQREKER